MKTNAVIENMLTRRSIRKFKDDPVSHEDLETIVTCGQWAANARNYQQWYFIVIDKQEKFSQLFEPLSIILPHPGYDMYSPSALIIVGHAKDSNFGRQDDGCAMENMMLAAHSLGLGSVWINQFTNHCDEPTIRPILTSFGLPEDYEIFGALALGYADQEPEAKPRKSTVLWV